MKRLIYLCIAAFFSVKAVDGGAKSYDIPSYEEFRRAILQRQKKLEASQKALETKPKGKDREIRARKCQKEDLEILELKQLYDIHGHLLESADAMNGEVWKKERLCDKYSMKVQKIIEECKAKPNGVERSILVKRGEHFLEKMKNEAKSRDDLWRQAQKAFDAGIEVGKRLKNRLFPESVTEKIRQGKKGNQDVKDK